MWSPDWSLARMVKVQRKECRSGGAAVLPLLRLIEDALCQCKEQYGDAAIGEIVSGVQQQLLENGMSMQLLCGLVLEAVVRLKYHIHIQGQGGSDTAADSCDDGQVGKGEYCWPWLEDLDSDEDEDPSPT